MVRDDETLHDILASIRQALALADDLHATGKAEHFDPVYERIARKHAAAAHHGIGDREAAGRILRDAVNLALDMGAEYLRRGGSDPVLFQRHRVLLEERKPRYHRHHGLGVGDMVEERAFGSRRKGEVVRLDPTDNNRAYVRDEDGSLASVVAEWCVRVDTFDGPEEPGAIPMP